MEKMTLTDILPLEAWIEFEKEINSRSGLNASVFDENGMRITNYKKWANQLCPEIKTNKKGQTFICAAAHQNLAGQAMQTRKPVVEACDAGLVKIVVPIFVNNTFLGTAGGCGLLPENDLVEAFLVSKVTEMDVRKIETLAASIACLSDDDAQALVIYLQNRIDEIVKYFEESPNFFHYN
jgi:ligand-binding sensor protein